MVAPFAFWLVPVLILLCAQPAHSGDCPADNTSEAVQVSYIYDGDTVKLADGRRLRFIGINTPELGRQGAANQPLAEAARDYLDQLLDRHSDTLLLQHGKQQHDHYGRLLAHAFLKNGDNVATQLLSQGLATTTVIPPNNWGAPCYLAIENEARNAKRGLWALPGYQSQTARSLSPDTSGYRIVNSRVMATRRSRKNLWLDLDGTLTVQIPLENIHYFKCFDPGNLAGSHIEVRGWIRPDGNRLKLAVKHPAAMVIMTTP